jgi:exoribonuclease II
VGSIRNCEQCGTSFEPRREHARFCSARCRVAWNREHAGDAAAGENALDWSLGAMAEAIARFDQILCWDLSRLVAAISEAVWWVTLVDATLVRYHPDSYDTVLDDRPAAHRQMIAETLAGLRFVRNQMGRHRDLADFMYGVQGADWTWRTVPAPTCDELSEYGQEWEQTRYQAYQQWLAGREITECFTLAAGFLNQTAVDAAEPSTTVSSDQ